MNRTCRQRAAHEVVAREQTCRVLWVHERQIQEDALDDEKDADCGDDDADAACDPVDAWVGGPTEDEKADGHEPCDN